MCHLRQSRKDGLRGTAPPHLWKWRAWAVEGAAVLMRAETAVLGCNVSTQDDMETTGGDGLWV